ncbi:unnamed protein product, partial [Mesorhabditis belari]|uniref:Small subunit processome component 20 homolog n=1 Tax=Mesorhabditis belari TaxID=2138241 RepID=A0AAF3J4A1_9BILA
MGKWTLETIENVLKGIAQRLSDKQRLLIYRLLISIMVILQRVAESTQEEQEIKMVKSLRRSIMERIRQFVLAFADCEWSAEQVKALWRWVILPHVEVVHRDERSLTVALSSVVGVIAAIAQMPKLFHLLCARLEVENLMTCPLKIMIDSLMWEKTVPRYMNMIRLGIVSMLEYADETPKLIADIEYLPVQRRDDVNYGTSLLVTQMDILLEYIISTLERPSNPAIIGENLKILNGISPFINSKEVAKRFAFCLLHLLERRVKGTKPESIANLLSTLSSIVENLDDPVEVYCKLPKFFAVFDNRTTREVLGNVCDKLGKNPKCTPIDVEILNCLTDLESWNAKRLDEPDFDRRANGYSRIAKIFQKANDPPNLHLLAALAQSNAHTISTIDDIALRAQASLNLRDLNDFIAKPIFNEKEVYYMIDHHLLPLIIRGFRQEQQNVRDEFIRDLNGLVSTFPQHGHLSQMSKAKNVEDPDRDFFENAVHIQIGRRRAGFKILSEQIDSGEVVMRPQILVAYFIPLLRHYMLNVTEKMSSVSDAALELLVSILKKTSWNAYIKIMDQYINQMAQDLESEKAYVRIVCAILDAFHFDATIAKQHEKRGRKQKEVPMEVDVQIVQEPNEGDDEEVNLESQPIDQNAEEEVSPEVVYEKVVKNLLPKLKAAINGKLNPKAKDVHKLAMDAGQKHYQEDDDIRRAPITLAAAKVLLHMPPIVIDHNLHGVIMKLVELLVARSDRVRETARKVMTQVVLELGPRYFPFIIREMEHVMQRGYQVHVLIFTTHLLIGVMRDQLKPGNLDSCLDVIMKLCCEDLFYGAAEEKEVEAIRAKVPEAKAKRTMDTVENVGRFIGIQSLRSVLAPLYEVIETKPTAKVIKSIGEVLRHMAIGIKDNAGISVDTSLVFSHQLLTENVAKMKNNVTNEKKSKGIIKPESCLIIPKEPRRIGEISKHSLKSRSHVFVEYALQILAFVLQNKKLDAGNLADIEKLDPFVSIMAECLALKYDKVNSLALRCVYRMLPYPLPTLHANTKSLCERLFVILADYSAMGNAGNRQTVLELNQLLFKTFDGLIKISSATLLDAKHVELLLNYVATDVLDSAKQATAFALLKTIIAKGIQHPMLIDIIKLLREQAVLSEFPHVQAQCRLVIAAFVGQHPQSRAPKAEIQWWLEQLEYEHEGGRLSASEMLNLFFGNFLPDILDEISLLALVKIGSRLVNDSLPKCRRFCALSIKTLLSNVSEASRNEAFTSCIDWLNSEQEGNYAVAAGIIVQLVNVEGERFRARGAEAITHLSKMLSKEDALETFAENTILSIIEALRTILQHSNLDSNVLLSTVNELLGILSPFCRCVQEMEDVRRAASELIGQSLAMIDAKALTDPSPFDVCDWMIFQMRATKLTDPTAQQAIKNLLSLSSAISDSEKWQNIVERTAKVCHFEIRKLPEQAIRRLFLFKFCAALAMKFKEDTEKLNYIVECFMPSVTREMLKKSTKNTDVLFDMATQVGDLIKGLVGEAEWANLLSKNTREITEKAEDRKISKKEKNVANVEQAITDRQKKYKKKAEAKKRKIDMWKPYRVGKRKRLEDLRAQLSDEDE